MCSWLPALGRPEGVMRAHGLSVPRARPVPQSCVNWECHLDQAQGFSPSRAAAWAQGPGDARRGTCLCLLFPGDPACAPRLPVPEPRLCLEFQDQGLCGQCGSQGQRCTRECGPGALGLSILTITWGFVSSRVMGHIL